MTQLSKEDFFKLANVSTPDDYSARQYKEYCKLTDSHLEKVNRLCKMLGNIIKFKRGSKDIEMKVAAVISNNGRVYKLKDTGYSSYPCQVRLNYPDYETNTKRSWDGFWTSKINNIII